jgi:hypothetical protein
MLRNFYNIFKDILTKIYVHIRKWHPVIIFIVKNQFSFIQDASKLKLKLTVKWTI